jgi:hypothetical protein
MSQPNAAKKGVQHVQLNYKTHPGSLLTVITPDDSNFDDEMALDFPRYVRLKKYPAMRPYMVILRNDTDRTARAYDVVWHGQAADPNAPGSVVDTVLGEQGAITTPLEMRRPGGIWQNDKSIPPGGVRLLTPLFNGGPAEASSFGFFHNMPAALPDPTTYSAIHAELDCVVYGNGSFAGPNRRRLLLRYFITRDAQHDEALAIVKRLRSTPKDPQLKAALDLRMKIGSSNTHPNRRAMPMYIHARAVAAQEFQQILLHEGHDQLRQTVEELVARMSPHERFTALGGVYHRKKFLVNGVSTSPKD